MRKHAAQALAEKRDAVYLVLLTLSLNACFSPYISPNPVLHGTCPPSAVQMNALGPTDRFKCLGRHTVFNNGGRFTVLPITPAFETENILSGAKRTSTSQEEWIRKAAEASKTWLTFYVNHFCVLLRMEESDANLLEAKNWRLKFRWNGGEWNPMTEVSRDSYLLQGTGDNPLFGYLETAPRIGTSWCGDTNPDWNDLHELELAVAEPTGTQPAILSWSIKPADSIDAAISPRR